MDGARAPGRDTMTRIGPKMDHVRALVARGPLTLIDVARQVGPNGSLRYGYAIVDRAIAAGLVRTGAPLPGRRGVSLHAV